MGSAANVLWIKSVAVIIAFMNKVVTDFPVHTIWIAPAAKVAVSVSA